ncbi:membrane associated rhomboid family serine protease [Filimonas zeae]|uniref:Rhomboid family intramembrane serine protease n=1 Tax=Filimonas zeae TaxID=1737353 RepID=A0A917J738_9BACT|nr:rhomboid family intramembrane serine protease [Filimonas zeae]MDR6342727.1 membrane associated rhomboid family serine protease [Filimonas zeae]GGH82466.1 rhomboid family intramembrane serine protease [Filimonas zeae]
MAVMEQGRRNKMILGQDNNSLTWLIIANATIFVVLIFIQIVYRLSSTPLELYNTQILSWLNMPANPQELLTHPWTIITHMFTHYQIWDIIGTVLWLWAFGFILQDLSGNRRLVPIYLYGGIAGALFFALSTNLVPSLNIGTTQTLHGAGAALMAIVVATTTLAPGYRLFTMLNGGIPLWVLTLIFVVIDYASVAAGNAPVALAHLGGAAIGFLYIKQLQKGNDWGEWMFTLANKVDSLFNPEKKHLNKPVSQRHFYKASRAPYEKKSNITQQRVDDLLDKINQQGYSSLSQEEKDFLKRASEQQD